MSSPRRDIEEIWRELQHESIPKLVEYTSSPDEYVGSIAIHLLDLKLKSSKHRGNNKSQLPGRFRIIGDRTS